MEARGATPDPAPAGPPVCRRLAVVVGTSLGWAALTALLTWGSDGALTQVQEPGPAPLDALLAVAAALTGWLLLSWLCGGLVLTVLARAPRMVGTPVEALAARISPALVRRMAATLLGVAVVALPAASGGAALAATTSPTVHMPVPVPGPGHDATVPLPSLHLSLDRPAQQPLVALPAQPGWTPDRPARPRRQHRAADTVRLMTSVPHRELATVDEVVVRAGDTLWAIAGRALGPGATDAEIAVEWPRWYAANRSAIGDDPGLLLPGEVLRAPATG